MRLAVKSMLKIIIWIILPICFIESSCSQVGEKKVDNSGHIKEIKKIRPGAHRTEEYIFCLQEKKVALVANHTSTVGNIHLLDSLLNSGIEVVKIFSPEHGFKGTLGAGEEVKDHFDDSSNISVISLYGNNYKPKNSDLKDLDIVVFDIQDVGVRFYTYISTMHYVMEACAENDVEFMILDRPNPNGFYIDGPVLEDKYASFVGIHPIPLVYGMTLAELAGMINDEGWLNDSVKCKLRVVRCENYTHDSLYQLPEPPSPNLPNMRAVYLYPSLGLFEGTVISEGRGTPFPFQAFGHTDLKGYDFSFVPVAIEGVSSNPKCKNDTCYGLDLRVIILDTLIQNRSMHLDWLYDAYNNYPGNDFFLTFFYNLTGTKQLRQHIESGVSINEIRQSWVEQHELFKAIREKYLLYGDFCN